MRYNILMFLILLFLADFAISEDSNYEVCASTIFVDSLYYVFWSDLGQPPSIYTARVSPSGSVIDTAGSLLYRGKSQFGARAAYDGQNFLVVLRDSC